MNKTYTHMTETVMPDVTHGPGPAECDVKQTEPALCARAPIGMLCGADASLPAAVPLLLQSARARTRQHRTDDGGVAGRHEPGRRARRSAGASCPAASRRRAATSKRSSQAAAAGLYTNLITAGVALTRERWRSSPSVRPRPRAAFLPGRRPPSENADRIAAYKGGSAKEEGSRSRRGCASSACRSPSTRRSIATTSTASQHHRLAVELGAGASNSHTCSTMPGRSPTAPR